MAKNVNIKEIFTSIQGEGLYIGTKQLFIRFCGCNLHCSYCDTEYGIENSKQYSVEDLLKEVGNNSDCHSVSLTGGEPLLNTEFLQEFLPQCKLPVYLETNATLSEELVKIIDYVDYIAADIKLPSCSGNGDIWDKHDKFFEIAIQKNLFAKIVFDENITDSEIINSTKLAKKYGIEIILQPKCSHNNINPDMDFVSNVMDKFLSHYKKVRMIPQVHKFLNVR